MATPDDNIPNIPIEEQASRLAALVISTLSSRHSDSVDSVPFNGAESGSDEIKDGLDEIRWFLMRERQ